MNYRQLVSSFAIFIILFAGTTNIASAQNRYFGANKFVLDDGTGNLSGIVWLSDKGGSLGIDATGTQTFAFPNTCALLDLSSTTKGLLIPRMTALQEAAICGGTPPEGLMVYNTTTHSVDVFSGTSWTPASGSGWSLTGNNIPAGGTGAGQNYIGTNNAQDFVIATSGIERGRFIGVAGGNQGFLGLNTVSPAKLLDVNGTFNSTGNSTIGSASGTTNTFGNSGAANNSIGNGAGATNAFGNGGGGTNNSIGLNATLNSIGNTSAQNQFGFASTLNGFGVSATTNNMGTAGVSTNTILGTTNINNSGNSATTIGSTSNTSGVSIASNNANAITLDVTGTGNNLVMNNIAPGLPSDIGFVTLSTGGINANSGNARLRTLSSIITGSNGVEVTYPTPTTADAHFTHTNAGVVFADARFINTGSQTLSITGNSGGVGTTFASFNGANDAVGINNIATNNGTTTIGNTTAGGAVAINSFASITGTSPVNALNATTSTNTLTGQTGNNITATTGNNTLLASAASGQNVLNANGTTGQNNLNANGLNGQNNITANAGGTNNILGTTNINTTAYFLTQMGNLSSHRWLNINGVADAASTDPTGSSNWDVNLTGDMFISGLLRANNEVIASLTPGQVVFPDANRQLTGDATFFWDNTAKVLDLGTSTTNAVGIQRLQVTKDEAPGAGGDAHQIIITGATTTTQMLELGYNTTGNNGTIQSFNQTFGATNLLIQPVGGASNRTIVGRADALAYSRLEVNGVANDLTGAAPYTNGPDNGWDLYDQGDAQIAGIIKAGTASIIIDGSVSAANNLIAGWTNNLTLASMTNAKDMVFQTNNGAENTVMTAKSAGNLDFPVTVSPMGLGTISQNGNRLIHTYNGVSNFFAGTNAGNYSMGVAATSNTGVGQNALNALTTGGGNTAVGTNALQSNQAGNFNTALGNSSLPGNISGSQNTAVGSSAMTSNTSGSGNTAVGSSALSANQTGANNTAVGIGSMGNGNNVANVNNVAVGNGALNNAGLAAANNTSVGALTGQANTTGTSNSFFGFQAGKGNAGGSSNTALGSGALQTNVSGGGNTAIGNSAMVNANGNGSNNVAVGSGAIGTGTAAGSNNVAVGNNAGNNITSGNANVGIGSPVLTANTTGGNNVAIGTSALNTNVGGSQNTAVGGNALTNSNAGTATDNNTALGWNAGTSNTTGTSNTFIGSNTSNNGNITSGTNNTFLGSTANASGNFSNATAIGTRAQAGASNTVIIGAINGTNGAAADALIGIGVTQPDAGIKLDVIGNTNINNGDATALHINPAFTTNINTGTSTGLVNISTSTTTATGLVTVGTSLAATSQQRLFVNGLVDAVPGNTLGGNAGVWDIVDAGDLWVAGLTNSVQSVVTSLTPGQVVFPDANKQLIGDAQFFWDNGAKRLDIGTSTTNVSSGAVSKLQVSADENPANGDAHQVIITGDQAGGNANEMLELGYNTTGNNGTIQTYNQTVGPTNLLINPAIAPGAVAAVGRTIVGNASAVNTSRLEVNGVVNDLTGVAPYTNGPDNGWDLYDQGDAQIAGIIKAGTASIIIDGSVSASNNLIAAWTNNLTLASMTNAKDMVFRTNNGVENTVLTAKSAGNLDIPVTVGPTLGLGTISQNGSRFIHSFGGVTSFFGGTNAGNLSLTGTNNTGVGDNALTALTNGSNNSAFGSTALQANTTGAGNTAVGFAALTTNLGGNNNTATGMNALKLNSAGANNVANGENALQNNTSSDNTAVGTDAMSSNLGGSGNAALGRQALLNNQAGSRNVAVGIQALLNSSSDDNTSVGAFSMIGAAMTGTQNTAIGKSGLPAVTSGGDNSSIGFNAGAIITTGSNNTFLGANTNASANNLSNATAVGAGATVGASSSLVLGNTALPTNVGVGVNIPLTIFDVVGTTNLNADAGSTALTQIGSSTGIRRWLNINGTAEAVSTDATGSANWDVNLTGDMFISGLLRSNNSVVAALTTGQVVFPDANKQLSGSPNLFWDITNSRLGVGTNVPEVTLDVVGATNINNSDVTHTANFATQINTGTSTGTVTIGNGAAGAISVTSGSTFTESATVNSLTATAAGGNTISATNAAGVNNITSTATGSNNISGPTNINNNVNSATQINTGTSTGTVTIGNAAAGAIGVTSGSTFTESATVNSLTATAAGGNTITATNAAGVNNITSTATGSNNISGPTNINNSVNSATQINTGTSTGTVTIGNGAAGAIGVTSGSTFTESATANSLTATTGDNTIASTAGQNNLNANGAAGKNNLTATGGGSNNIAGPLNINTGGTFATIMGNSTSLQWMRINGAADAVAGDAIGSAHWDLAVDGDIFASGMIKSATATFSGLTPGQVVFPAVVTSQLTGSANLFWDNTNNRLGIGTNAPAFTLDVRGTSSLEQTNPFADVTYSLGTSSLRWQELFLGPSSLHIYALATEVNGGAGPAQNWALGAISGGANPGDLTISNNATTRVTVTTTGDLNVGTKFSVTGSSGNIGTINNVSGYTWPAAHQAGFLQNDGTGGLTWGNSVAASRAGLGSYAKGNCPNNFGPANINVAGGNSVTKIIPVFPGSITGISAVVQNPLAAGQMVVNVVINGVVQNAVGQTCTVSPAAHGGNYNFVAIPAGQIPIVPGDQVEVQIQSIGIGGGGNDMTATVFATF